MLLFLWIGPDADVGRWRFQSPAEPGLYAVGHEVFEVVDPARNDRTLSVNLWYPADPETAEGAPSVYTFILGIGHVSELSLDGAAPSRTIGFPLVIYSHGGGGTGTEADILVESLASHGFVVAAPNHLGGDILVFGGGSDSAEVLRRNRPLDVSLVIDELLARNQDPLDPLYAHIHPAEIGVAGFSFGGWTATAMASGHVEPSTGLETPPDPRVRAVATVARGNGGYESPDDEPSQELTAVHVPTFLMRGTLDVDASDAYTTRAWDLVSGSPIYRADVVGAAHQHFSWQCDFGEALIALGVSEAYVNQIFANFGGWSFTGLCREPALSIAEAQRIRDVYLTAFFERHLLHDGRYDAFLTPDYAAQHEPSVVFQRKDAGPP